MMKENETIQKKLAVLIDADNASPKIIEGLLDEIAKYGIASVKRVYGDWTSPNLLGWKEVLLENALNPVQQFSYTSGKNSTDSALIIDAMDLLYTEKLDGFCIVSSDSDFTRLCLRLRESGMLVYGFGESKTPKAFVGACDRFIFTEILTRDEKNYARYPVTMKQLQSDKKLVSLLVSAVEASANENGWSHLGSVGQNIANKAPDFDPRNFGYKKLYELMKATKLFQIDERSNDNSPAKAVYVRLKK